MWEYLVNYYFYHKIKRRILCFQAKSNCKACRIECDLFLIIFVESAENMFFKLELNGLPFTPAENQVIYVENEYNEEINRYIQSNYDAICEHFKKSGYEFCYLPYLAGALADNGVADYYAPYSQKLTDCLFQSDFLLQYMANPQNRGKVPPSLVYYSDAFAEKGVCIYRGVSLDESYLDDNDFSELLGDIRDDISSHSSRGSTILFRRCKDIQWDDECDEDVTDTDVKTEYIDADTLALLREIEQRINEVRRRGVSAYVLEQMINKEDKISRLVITSDYRILLPDYNNMEIYMTPLVKAVYLLFLRHPEGIIFKHLMDYRDELKGIYKKVRGSRGIFTLDKSVNAATDPTKNSINEKCARIREAFVTKFDERLAKHYIITGERGEPKRITLQQDMITWE